MDKQKLVLDLVRRAGIVEPPPVGAGTFAGEPLLVLHGGHKSDLDVYGQHGQQIGTAWRSRGRYSRDGYRYRYELPDLGAGLIVDISKGRFVSVPRDFTITGVDGSRIANARRYTPKGQPVLMRDDRRSWESFAFERDGETIAELWQAPRKEFRRTRAQAPASNPIGSLRKLNDRFFSSQLFLCGGSLGTTGRANHVPVGVRVGYVIALQPDTPELLSTIAVAACLIANNAFVSESGGGGN